MKDKKPIVITGGILGLIMSFLAWANTVENKVEKNEVKIDSLKDTVQQFIQATQKTNEETLKVIKESNSQLRDSIKELRGLHLK